MDKIIYGGIRDPERGAVAFVLDLTADAHSSGGHYTDLPPRHDLRNHSPDGFEWGYSGSGPAQLALALCAHALDGDDARALRVYQRVKEQIIAPMTRENSWLFPKSHVLEAIGLAEQRDSQQPEEGDPSEPGHPDNPRSNYEEGV